MAGGVTVANEQLYLVINMSSVNPSASPIVALTLNYIGLITEPMGGMSISIVGVVTSEFVLIATTPKLDV